MRPLRMTAIEPREAWLSESNSRVLELAVVICRWLQMGGAMILTGSSLFLLYTLPSSGPGSAVDLRWPARMLLACTVVVLVACALGFLAQTAVLAGTLQDAATPESLSAAMGMSFGRSSMARLALASALLVALPVIGPRRRAWIVGGVGGGLICGSFAWMGHGAATEGALGLLHLSSDIIHALAAGVWVGALVAFLIVSAAANREPPQRQEQLHRALRGFSGVGSALVAVLIATGLINGWFVIGLRGLPHLWTTAYGQLLTIKLLLFAAMLGLAAANRFLLTPQLGAALEAQSPTVATISALRVSLAMEAGISMAVLALVAWFGTLAPPSVS
jgi:copper resistance protein D